MKHGMKWEGITKDQWRDYGYSMAGSMVAAGVTSKLNGMMDSPANLGEKMMQSGITSYASQIASLTVKNSLMNAYKGESWENILKQNEGNEYSNAAYGAITSMVTTAVGSNFVNEKGETTLTGDYISQSIGNLAGSAARSLFGGEQMNWSSMSDIDTYGQSFGKISANALKKFQLSKGLAEDENGKPVEATNEKLNWFEYIIGGTYIGMQAVGNAFTSVISGIAKGANAVLKGIGNLGQSVKNLITDGEFMNNLDLLDKKTNAIQTKYEGFSKEEILRNLTEDEKQVLIDKVALEGGPYESAKLKIEMQQTDFTEEESKYVQAIYEMQAMENVQFVSVEYNSAEHDDSYLGNSTQEDQYNARMLELEQKSNIEYFKEIVGIDNWTEDGTNIVAIRQESNAKTNIGDDLAVLVINGKIEGYFRWNSEPGVTEWTQGSETSKQVNGVAQINPGSYEMILVGPGNDNDKKRLSRVPGYLNQEKPASVTRDKNENGNSEDFFELKFYQSTSSDTQIHGQNTSDDVGKIIKDYSWGCSGSVGTYYLDSNQNLRQNTQLVEYLYKAKGKEPELKNGNPGAHKAFIDIIINKNNNKKIMYHVIDSKTINKRQFDYYKYLNKINKNVFPKQYNL